MWTVRNWNWDRIWLESDLPVVWKQPINQIFEKESDKIGFPCCRNTAYTSDLRRNLIKVIFACSLNATYKSDFNRNLFWIGFNCSLRSVCQDPYRKCHEQLLYWVEKIMSARPFWLIRFSAALPFKRISSVIIFRSWVCLPSCQLGRMSNLTLTFRDL